MQQGMDDDLYQSVGNYATDPRFTDRERLAIEFGERFAIAHTSIDDELWDRCRKHFSEVEMIELTAIAGFCVGMGRAFQVLDIARDFDVLWSREPTLPQ
jgi:alkylhydroperoxidase family enzyme